ncbi:MAG: riboflavin synthase [Planctomycetaceae bacterium]|nr:riboflavin synthase [Planctomycetaceae bacterium]
MFTGLIEGKGSVAEILDQGEGVLLRVQVPEEMLRVDASCLATQIGDSVAINGCCLTVIAMQENCWDFQAGQETLSRTNLGKLTSGSPVNLERAMLANARLGGHIVQGHVDGLGTVLEIDSQDEWVTMWFAVTESLSQYMVTKGSVTVDGISLTLVDVEPDRFSVALIPHTLEVTTLGSRAVDDHVNIETDIMGKYAHKLLGPWMDRLK